jgi:hypothetical protein
MAIANPALLAAAGALREHGTPAGGSMAGNLWGIPGDHLLGLFAPLLLPLAIWLFLPFVRGRASAGSTFARRWLNGYEAATPVQHAAAALLLIAGLAHLGLVPGHWSEERGLTLLFAVNSACFVAVGLAVYLERWWKPSAIVLIVLTLLGYLAYVAGGKENLDPVGVITLMVEVAALGLTLLPARETAAPSRKRLALAGGATVMAVMLTGALMWGSELKAERAGRNGAGVSAMADQPMQGMIMQSVLDAPPTPQQQAAAARLADETEAAVARYQDVNLAIADGYRPVQFGKAATAHWANPKYAKDGRVLDPARPEDLVYANTAHGPVLIGAMFTTQRPGGWGPDFGGPLTAWHQHDNICFGPGPAGFAGFLSPFDSCPAATLGLRTPAMLHLWTVNVPGGPWAPLDPDQVAKLLGLTKAGHALALDPINVR